MILPSEKVALQNKQATRYTLPGKAHGTISFGVDRALGNFFQYDPAPDGPPAIDEDRLKQHEIVALLKKWGQPSSWLDKAVSAYMMDIDPGQVGLRGLRASEVLLLPSELRGVSKGAKFPKGETMTIEEVAAVVGPEFKEMNENPPPSVVKVMEEMQKKAGPEEDALSEFRRRGVAPTEAQQLLNLYDKYKGRDENIASKLSDKYGVEYRFLLGILSRYRRAQEGLLRGASELLPVEVKARFHEGPPGAKEFEDWKEDQPQEFQDDWDENTDEHKDKFKEARLVWATLPRVAGLDEFDQEILESLVYMTEMGDVPIKIPDLMRSLAWPKTYQKGFVSKLRELSRQGLVVESPEGYSARLASVRRARFEEGPEGTKQFEAWMKKQPKETQEDWAKYTEENKDKFKEASWPSAMSPQSVTVYRRLKEWAQNNAHKYRDTDSLASALARQAGHPDWADEPTHWVYEIAYDIRDSQGGMAMYADDRASIPEEFALLEEAMFAEGESVALKDLPQELQDNVNDPPPEVQKLKDELTGVSEEAMFDKEGPALPVEMYASETRTRSTWEKAAASGLYGYTRAIQTDVEATIRKAQKRASVLARGIYAKDENVVPFLLKHAKRANSMPAKLLLAAMKDLGPKIPEKTASEKTSGLGMYGVATKTARLGLSACSELRAFVGEAASDLHQRRVAGYPHITGFLKQHHKEAKCEYSRLILGCYPDAPEEASSKKASGDSVKLASGEVLEGGSLVWEE